MHYRVTEQGAARLRVFGIDVDALGRRPRPLLRYCVDWSEQRHHLAGGLGAALAQRMFELDWIRRSAHSRAVTITSAGAAGLHATFGLLTEELAERHAGS